MEYRHIVKGLLLEALRDAKIVQVDPDREYILAWWGGHGIHIYTITGKEVGIWHTGDFEQTNLTYDEVISEMLDQIASGAYVDDYIG